MRSFVALLALLAGMLALPAATAAAGGCALTTSLNPGHAITVTGSGFDANASVAITQTWGGSNATKGGNTGPQTTTSQVSADAAGAFTLEVPAGPGRGGTYDFQATAGGCTATAQAAAVETAGGLNPGSGGGGTATPPATDTAPVAVQGGGAPVPLAPIGVIAIAAALLALTWTVRRARAA